MEQIDMDDVRRIIDEYAGLSLPASEIADEADLYELGLTSRTQVSVMLALEDTFDVEFSTKHAVRSTFSSVRSIVAALRENDVLGDDTVGSTSP